MSSDVVRHRGGDEPTNEAPIPEVLTNLAPPPPPIPAEDANVQEESQERLNEARERVSAAPETDTAEPIIPDADTEALKEEIHRLRTLLESHEIDPDDSPPAVERAPTPPTVVPAPDGGSLLSQPPIERPEDLASQPDLNEALFFMTNRFAPMKIALRTLVNLRTQGQWPELRNFQLSAAIAARDVGLRLKNRDQANGVVAADRRSTGFPVSPQEKKSLDAFIDRFTISVETGRPTGPLAILGFASVQDGRAVLTEAGWQVGIEPSPLLEGVAGRTLSQPEQELVRKQLTKAPREIALVREFLEFVRIGRGIQTILDEFLLDTHPEWADDVASWRSAMLGRLRELDAVEVEGRGMKARIRLLLQDF